VRCPGYSTIEDDTITAAHELIEAATDPDGLGYAWPSDAAWGLLTFGELGDMCEAQPDTWPYQPPDLPFAVQRTWSNAAAMRGSDPCVPTLGKPFFAAAPVLPDTVSALFYNQSVSTPGVRIAVGEQRTIEVDLFSESDVGQWEVAVADASQFEGRPPALELSLDRSSGSRGNRLRLTIRALRTDDTWGGGMFVLSSSQNGKARSYWPGFVQN
jgi:hypothetical protein